MATSRFSNPIVAGSRLALFGLPFLGAGLFLTHTYYSEYAKWWAAGSWQETPYWIESAELERNNDSDGDTYKALATYRYEFGGKTYQGDRVALNGSSDNIGDFQKKTYRELSRYTETPTAGERRPFRCDVNPQNPSESVLYQTLRWERQAFLAIFALTFPAVGAGLVFAGLWGSRVMRKEAALREKYPGEPWKWKLHWAGTTISKCPTIGRLPLFFYTLWSALIVSSLIFATALSGAFQTDRSAWLVLIFLALWRGPAWLTVGKAKLELQDTPAWPGGVLRGSILLAKPLPARAVPELHLSCEKRVTSGSGEDKSTVRETIWSARDTIPQDRVTKDFTGFRLPVSIAIPSAGPESGRGGDDSEEYLWNLKLAVSGTAVHSVFEIPVFRNGKSPTFMATAAGLSILETLTSDLPVLLAEQGIQAEFDQGGMPRTIIRPPAQRPSWIAFPFLFNLVWTGMAVVLVRENALLIGQILLIPSAASIWLLILWRLLYRRTVTFTRDGVKLRHHLGPASREETIGKSQITGISHDSNMISNNAKFYRVRIVIVLGQKKTVADGIKGSSVAEALVGRLEAWKQSG